MAYINWQNTFTYSVTLQLGPLPITVDVDLPTYGNYGGLGSLSIEDPVDELDAEFLDHDQQTLAAGFDLEARADADRDLLQDIVDFNRSDLKDPEASLYAGLTEFGILGSLALNAEGDLSHREIAVASRDAIQNITWGLKHLPDDELDDAQAWFAAFSADIQDDLGGLPLDQALDLVGIDVPKFNPHVADLLGL